MQVGLNKESGQWRNLTGGTACTAQVTLYSLPSLHLAQAEHPALEPVRLVPAYPEWS